MQPVMKCFALQPKSASKVALASVLFALFHLAASKPRSNLVHYNVETDKISVSGLSSGAFFAVQFHVAYSSTVMGVGAVAGGPFWCAQDNLFIALSSCMRTPAGMSLAFLINITYATALTGTIDNPASMRKHRAFIFSGTKDTVVDQGVGQKLVQYYQHFLQQDGISSEFSIPSEHALVTNDYGSSCSFLGSPYLNNCGYSTAYHILQHIYGDINDANSSHIDENNLFEFDQSEFFSGLPKLVSLDTTGFIYVPTSCQDNNKGKCHDNNKGKCRDNNKKCRNNNKGKCRDNNKKCRNNNREKCPDNKKKCRLHIAFHGCKQGREYVSTTFALHAGYNGLAETNGIIILYPQATYSKNLPYNPNGCWDWWGYSSPSYASKLGPQMAGIKQMLNRIAY